MQQCVCVSGNFSPCGRRSYKSNAGFSNPLKFPGVCVCVCNSGRDASSSFSISAAHSAANADY